MIACRVNRSHTARGNSRLCGYLILINLLKTHGILPLCRSWPKASLRDAADRYSVGKKQALRPAVRRGSGMRRVEGAYRA
jgi:hypothetical protein